MPTPKQPKYGTSIGTGCVNTTGLLHSVAGVLIGFVISHTQASNQTVTFYDNTSATGTKLLVVDVAPERCPFYVMFPREFRISFDTGLFVAVGNCSVAVWSIGHGS